MCPVELPPPTTTRLATAPLATLLSAVAWVTVGRDREESVPPVPALLPLTLKSKQLIFFAFSLVLFGTFSLSAPWVVCCVRLSEVREGRMGGRGSLYCVEIYLGGFYINLNYFVFPALKLKLAAVLRITRLFFSPLTYTQRFSLFLFSSAVCHSCLINHLRKERYCPRCEMVINNAKPNIK